MLISMAAPPLSDHRVPSWRLLGSPPLVFPRPQGPGVRARDFVALDEMHVYYAGDFCSSRAPGFEAAALSGIDVAVHMNKVLTSEDGVKQDC